jgi:uncharacterized protein (DUF2164 family)
MNSKMKISREKRQDMICEIKGYFLKERDEEIGDLAASFVLDFFIEKLGLEIYNQGVYDSYKYMSDKIEDLLGIQL